MSHCWVGRMTSSTSSRFSQFLRVPSGKFSVCKSSQRWASDGEGHSEVGTKPFARARSRRSSPSYRVRKRRPWAISFETSAIHSFPRAGAAVSGGSSFSFFQARMGLPAAMMAFPGFWAR